MKKFLPLLILVLLISCEGKDKSSSGSGSTDSREAVESETLTTQFMVLINNHRKSIGLKALTHAEPLAAIALEHSYNMATKEVSFGHTGFSSRCSEARDAMSGGNLCAENVAMGQKTAEAVYNAWMNSSSHRANIENGRLTHCGLGISQSSSGTYYWTHLFLEK